MRQIRRVTWVLSVEWTNRRLKEKETGVLYFALSFRTSCLAFNVQLPLPRLASTRSKTLTFEPWLSLSLTATNHFSPTMNGYAFPIIQTFYYYLIFTKSLSSVLTETELHCFIFWFRLTKVTIPEATFPWKLFLRFLSSNLKKKKKLGHFCNIWYETLCAAMTIAIGKKAW